MPCYNEEEAIAIFYEETDKVSRKLRDYEFEFIFVNNGSKDNSISIMKSLAQKDDRVKYANFLKNLCTRKMKNLLPYFIHNIFPAPGMQHFFSCHSSKNMI